MGRFDQTGRNALELQSAYLLLRVAERAAANVRFRRMFDARTVPLPGGIDRTADWVPILDDLDQPDSPWLWVTELQLRDDERKPEVLLAEAANFLCYAKDTDRQGGSFRVLPVFVYFTGVCSRPVLDMRSGGLGMRCDFVLIEFERDDAMSELRKVEKGERPWDALFWTVLMKGGGGPDELALWRRLLDETVPVNRRADVAYLTLQLSELTGALPAVRRMWEEFPVVESTVFKETVELGASQERVRLSRTHLLALLKSKYPGQVPEEYLEIVRNQESYPLLERWFQAALDLPTASEFLARMRE